MNNADQKVIISSDSILSIISSGESDFISGSSLKFTDFEINGNLRKDRASQVFLFINELLFLNCKFNNQFEFAEYSRINTIIFDNCSFNQTIKFTNLDKPVEFKNNCYFKEELIISCLDTNSKELKIIDAVIETNLKISGPSKKIILSNINIIETIKKGEIQFKKAKINSLQVNNTRCLAIKIIEDTIIEGEANFGKVVVNDFILNGAEIGLKLRLLSSELSNLEIDNLRGNRDIEISNTTINSKASIAMHMLNRTSISQCPFVNQLRLWGINNRKDTFFNLEKVDLGKLHFDKLYNEGVITLRELTIQQDGLLAINSSNLGRTDFILCDFSQAVLEFENSKITDAFFSETDFPKTVRIENKINHAQAQLAFGQLHTAFQKQGDTVRALEYQSREIEEHYRKLRWFITSKKPFVNFTWFNLWLNKVSNDFGRAWMKALIFSIALGILFFYGLVLSTEEYHFGFPITLNSNLIKAFFKFMNPLRFFETEALFTKPLSLSSISYLLDFGGRVFVAYGFYQTIQAFRRFGRK